MPSQGSASGRCASPSHTWAQLNRHDDRPYALGGRPVKADCHGVVAVAQTKLLQTREGVERSASEARLFAQLGGAQADGGIDATESVWS